MNKKELVSLIIEYGCHTREQGRYQAEADTLKGDAGSIFPWEATALAKRVATHQARAKASFDRILAELERTQNV